MEFNQLLIKNEIIKNKLRIEIIELLIKKKIKNQII